MEELATVTPNDDHKSRQYCAVLTASMAPYKPWVQRGGYRNVIEQSKNQAGGWTRRKRKGSDTNDRKG